MDIEEYVDHFSGETKYLISLTQGELRWIRFDMSVALNNQKNLDSFEPFLYDTDEFA
jgi:hypothetical protein